MRASSRFDDHSLVQWPLEPIEMRVFSLETIELIEHLPFHWAAGRYEGGESRLLPEALVLRQLLCIRKIVHRDAVLLGEETQRLLCPVEHFYRRAALLEPGLQNVHVQTEGNEIDEVVAFPSGDLEQPNSINMFVGLLVPARVSQLCAIWVTKQINTHK